MARRTALPSAGLPVSARSIDSADRAAGRAAGDRLRLALVLLIALCQGALYLCLLPPWQHYDEPTHFEYAWLFANRPGLPAVGSEDQAMRRELAAAMLEHRFYDNLRRPALLTDQQKIDVGITELLHPPAYYALVSLPLRLVRHLDLVSQLYVARAVSLALFLLTIAAAGLLMRDLVPAGHPLRWAVPLALSLIPPFVDLMTAVNNDVGAVAVFTLFLWGAVRLLRLGITWPRAAWVLGAAVLATATKNTAAVALVLALLALLLAFWLRRGWRWRWLLAATAGLAGALILSTLGWGDAAGWYRGDEPTVQESATRAAVAQAPLGARALSLETPAGGGRRSLFSPIVDESARQLAGQAVTVGAWIWSDRPALIASLGLSFEATGQPGQSGMARQVAVGSTPRFVGLTLTEPDRNSPLLYVVTARAPEGTGQPARLYVDGAVAAIGAFPVDRPPTFDDASSCAGQWAGARFENLVRNPSAEQAWPRLHPWLDRALVSYIHRSPAQTVAALFDARRLAPAFLPYLLEPALSSLILSFAWGHVRLTDPRWPYLAAAVGLLALFGALKWSARPRDAAWPNRRPALVFLALAALLVWGNTIARPLPLLGEPYVVPAARYTFPVIGVTVLVLVGGWLELWPRRYRHVALLGLIAGLLALNAVSVSAISSFYQILPA